MPMQAIDVNAWSTLQTKLTPLLMVEHNLSELAFRSHIQTYLSEYCTSDIERSIVSNHLYNAELWQFEDQARDPKADDTLIAAVKRRIDRLNQQRNDEIEHLNQWFYERLNNHMVATAPLNTETPGSVIDRMSILELKRHSMDAQAQRKDVDGSHVAQCKQKLNVLNRQRADLRSSLDDLLNEIKAGTRRFQLYFQFKMYNDTKLNPYLNGQKNN